MKNQCYRKSLMVVCLFTIGLELLANNHEAQPLVLSQPIAELTEWTCEQTLDPMLTEEWHKHLYSLFEAADKGDKGAAHQIELYIRNGYGRTDDYVNLHKVQEDALLRHDPNAISKLAIAKLVGLHGIDLDPEGGMALLMEACEMHHPDSLIELGNQYMSGKFVPKNNKKALKYYEQAIEHGSSYGHIKKGDALRADGRIEEALVVYKNEGIKGRAIGPLKAAATCLKYKVHQEEAVKLAEKAAVIGNPYANELLFKLYMGQYPEVQAMNTGKAMDNLEVVLRKGSLGLRKSLAAYMELTGEETVDHVIARLEGSNKTTEASRLKALVRADGSRANKLINKLNGSMKPRKKQ